MKKLSIIQLLVIIIGAVLGSFIAQLASKTRYLSWLAIGNSFGWPPCTINLGTVQFTLGLNIDITIATIIGLIIAIIICRKLG